MNGAGAKTPEGACFQHLGVALDTRPSPFDDTPAPRLRPVNANPGN